MASMNENEVLDLAQVILEQCTVPCLMTVGAHEFTAVTSGVRFLTHIHAFGSKGEREMRPSIMQMEMILNSSDYDDIAVTYPHKQGGSIETATHWTFREEDMTQLHRIIFALDYEGETVLSPRYF